MNNSVRQYFNMTLVLPGVLIVKLPSMMTPTFCTQGFSSVRFEVGIVTRSNVIDIWLKKRTNLKRYLY